tara:strand:- start:110 stop:706 length:597 start_codon:yes stop_codon:yes gene_type:complete
MKSAKINTIEVSKLKLNPKNPRTIKKDKFEKLKKSIKELPKMLKLRPIVVDEDFVVLGGNMRLQAVKELGIKEVHYIQESELTEEEKKQFIIKDNASFGDWDWDILANEWNNNELNEWGLDVWVEDDDPKDKKIDEDKFASEIDTYINAQIKQIVLYYNSDDFKNALENFEKIREDKNLNDNTEVVDLLMKNYFKNGL